MNGGTGMDVREKLVELLSKYFDIGDSYAYNLTRVKSAFACGTMGFDDFEEFDEETVEDIASYLIKNGVTIQEWVSVEDKLPDVVSIHKGYRGTVKKSIRVLCVCVQKSGKTMVKEGYCEWYNDYQEPRWQIPGTIDEVTHWQYLPQPPKGE